MRAARPDDARAVAQVQLRAWRSAYSTLLPAAAIGVFDEDQVEVRWRAAVTEPPSPQHQLLVALAGADVVGLAACGPTDDPPNGEPEAGELYLLLIDPAHQGAGHGSRLLAAAVEQLRDAGYGRAVLWLFAAEGGTQAFYESAGWALDGARRLLDMAGQQVPQVRLHTSVR